MTLTNKVLTEDEIKTFQEHIYRFYALHGRDFPWRQTTNPYHILVSEIMLQQTQVERVLEKYGAFIEHFPDFSSLAAASLKDILSAWQGMGYNRRALALKQLAEIVTSRYRGLLPRTVEGLSTLPGIGKTTAGEILAFAFNLPTAFIETNIRRVFIYCFFPNERAVKDQEIMPLVEATLDRDDPRTWYYALMDCGSMLKRVVHNPNQRSAHYKKQAPFENSDRRIRGLILRILLDEPVLTRDQLLDRIGVDSDRIHEILTGMTREGLIREDQEAYMIP